MKTHSLPRCMLALGLACGFVGVVQAAEPAPPAPDTQQVEQKLDAARQRLDAAAREVGELSAQLGSDTRNRLEMRFPEFGVRPQTGPLLINAPGMEMRNGPDGMRTLRGPGPERFRGMELATLSERLGRYFGVKSGVLVVRGGEQGVFGLQDGDVILAIDGREPTSAAHATRILGSYQPGEELTLKVQRDRKVENIKVTLPEAGPGRRGP